MNDNPCTHGMPGPATGLDCQDEGVMPPTPRRSTRVGTPFPARHPGQCDRCDLPVIEGQSIVALEHLVGENVERTEWIHTGCAS